MNATGHPRPAEKEHAVHITDQGRAGTVEYCERAIRLPLWWEFTLNGAYIWAPSPEQWDGYWRSNGVTGVDGRRAEILARVAEAAVTQRAPSARAAVGDDGVTLEF